MKVLALAAVMAGLALSSAHAADPNPLRLKAVSATLLARQAACRDLPCFSAYDRAILLADISRQEIIQADALGTGGMDAALASDRAIADLERLLAAIRSLPAASPERAATLPVMR
ncbi:MAG TPA: hypothetical protein VFL98_02130 [Candidatus Paceibacterota bacterium]|nr:hypothetical protein [Candidatus Paceibacterota bacterium]